MEDVYMEGSFSLEDKKDSDIVWEIGGSLKISGACSFDKAYVVKIRADGVIQLSLRPTRRIDVELEGYHDLTVDCSDYTRKVVRTFVIEQSDTEINICQHGAPCQNGLGVLEKIFRIHTERPRYVELAIIPH